jgi:hypothetical protein
MVQAYADKLCEAAGKCAWRAKILSEPPAARFSFQTESSPHLRLRYGSFLLTVLLAQEPNNSMKVASAAGTIKTLASVPSSPPLCTPELSRRDAGDAAEDFREGARAGVADFERDLDQAALRFAHHLLGAGDSLAGDGLQRTQADRLLENAREMERAQNTFRPSQRWMSSASAKKCGRSPDGKTIYFTNCVAKDYGTDCEILMARSEPQPLRTD